MAKSCRLLAELAAARAPQPLVSLARAVGLPLSTAHRLLETMCQESMVEQLPDRRYRVGILAFQMAQAAAASRSVLGAAEAVMRALATQVEESVSLVLFHDHDAHFVRCIEGPRTLRAVPARLGARMPLHCSGSGKVLLASLPEVECREVLARLPLRPMTAHTITEPAVLLDHLAAVRAQGYAVDDQELEDDLVCIAGPIRDQSGAVMAALSVSGHRSRIAGGRRAEVIASVVDATARISHALGATSRVVAANTALQAIGS